jgi:excisionase family DNA binding protein
MATEPLLTVRQVAEHLAVSRATVYEFVHKKILPPPVKVGGASRWRVKDVEDIKFGRRGLRPRRGRAAADARQEGGGT